MATPFQADLLAGGAVSERNVVVGNVVKEVNLILGQHKTGGDRVNRCITPSLVEETTILVKRLEVVDVLLGSEPVKVTNLEVRPLRVC